MKHNTSIIIVTHNGSKWIEPCLTSVFKTRLNGHFEVTVIDNASQDNTVSLIEEKFPEVILIKLKKNVGFAAGNNMGIQKALDAGFENIVLLNQDTEVEYDWLDHLVKAVQKEEVGIVQGMLLLGHERALTNNVGNALHYLGFGFIKHYKERIDSWYHKKPFEIGYASGACMLVTREVIEKIGMLDEKLFMYHEDLDFCWRAKLADYKVVVAPQSTIYHNYEFQRNKKLFYWTERNRWVVLLQNYSWGTLLKLSPMLLFIEVALFVYSILGGWVHYKIKGYFWVLTHILQIAKTRMQVQKMRTVSDAEVMKTMDSKLQMAEIQNSLLQYIVSPLSRWYFSFIKK